MRVVDGEHGAEQLLLFEGLIYRANETRERLYFRSDSGSRPCSIAAVPTSNAWSTAGPATKRCKECAADHY